MITVRPYKFTDRYYFEKMVNSSYKERKKSPPDPQKVLDTIGFFTGFPQTGKIYVITYKDALIGYSIVLTQWRLGNGGVSLIIDELYIDQYHRKYKAEINFIEFLLKLERVHSIEIHSKKIAPSSRTGVFKFFRFDKKNGPFLVKTLPPPNPAK